MRVFIGPSRERNCLRASPNFCNKIGPLRHLARRSDPVAFGGEADIGGEVTLCDRFATAARQLLQCENFSPADLGLALFAGGSSDPIARIVTD